ncbi:MAG: hypothetical protein WC150_05865 [Bacteroidia bacterium]
MESIKNACSQLSKNLIWWQIEPDNSQIDRDLDEFNTMTEKFYEIALKNYYKVEELTNSEKILYSAISYIDKAIACPPLRGQYEWFDDSLFALLELCNPNARLTQKELKFLEHIEIGIAKYRADEVQD